MVLNKAQPSDSDRYGYRYSYQYYGPGEAKAPAQPEPVAPVAELAPAGGRRMPARAIRPGR